MNKTNAQIKACARQNMLGHYGTVIGALIITLLVTFLLNLPFDSMAQQGLYYGVSSRVLLGGIGSVIVSLLSSLLSAGICHIHLQIARGQKTQFRELFYAFRIRPDRYIGYGLLSMLLSIVCLMPGYLCVMPLVIGSETATALPLGILGIALLIIGLIVLIVIVLSWAMTTYILLEDSDIRVMDAIRKSRQMMKGRKGRYFILALSFIGWILFSVLSFCIALLWIIPYVNQTQVCFYLELLPDQTQNTGSSKGLYNSAVNRYN